MHAMNKYQLDSSPPPLPPPESAHFKYNKGIVQVQLKEHVSP